LLPPDRDRLYSAAAASASGERRAGAGRGNAWLGKRCHLGG
jgi:hypothetical protein